MIQLIADSGSTKTHWRLVTNNDEPSAFQTEGLNPYHLSDLVILHILGKGVLPNVTTTPDEIHFYGAGCAAEENKQEMISCFKHFFPDAAIEVETDLLGAARALLGNSPGFIGILGTGSNTGIYDGKKIVKSVDSLGWILGDEGSGTYIGKEILRLWLRGFFSKEEEVRLSEFCSLTRDEIINRVYHDLNPNQFVAGFAKFAHENPSEKINDVVANSFNNLMERVVTLYDADDFTEMNFVGSVAWHFRDILMMIVQKHKYSIGKILQSPIDELVKYHLSKHKSDMS